MRASLWGNSASAKNAFCKDSTTHPVAQWARVSTSTQEHRVRIPDADYLP